MQYRNVTHTNNFGLGSYYFDFVLVAVYKTLLEGSSLEEMVFFLEDMFGDKPNGFAKSFRQDSYEENGDESSWELLLQVSEREFWETFSKIGTCFSSQEVFERATDKFNGKPYACVVSSTESSRPYFYRNHELIRQIVGELVVVACYGDLGLDE